MSKQMYLLVDTSNGGWNALRSVAAQHQSNNVHPSSNLSVTDIGGDQSIVKVIGPTDNWWSTSPLGNTPLVLEAYTTDQIETVRALIPRSYGSPFA